MELRPYQRRAVDLLWSDLQERAGNPCIVLPTGAGKSVIVAEIVHVAVEHDGRVLVLAHVKELLEQLAAALAQLCPTAEVGLYSAGLGRRELSQVTVAGIQSVWRRAIELFAEQPPDLILVDEAHLVPGDGDGMYRTLLEQLLELNPDVRLIGLTATPYRMGSGLIVGQGQLFDRIAHEVPVLDLIRAGWLSPLTSRAGRASVDTGELRRARGEFIAADAQELMNEAEVVFAACQELVDRSADRRSVLVFAAGVEHGRHVARVLREIHGELACEIFGTTPADERAALIAEFRAGRLKYLVNVAVLTTGFDAPNVDVVALLRPTLSAGLYVQMIGRGLRLAEGKSDCLILDFCGNIDRHGPIDLISARAGRASAGTGEALAKSCPECQLAALPLAARECPECGFEFPEPESATPHDARASESAVTSDEIVETVYEVKAVCYSVHVKRDAPEGHPRTMRVAYQVSFYQWISEWVCVEHGGYAGEKARVWWEQRSDAPRPHCADEAVELAEAGALAEPTEITVRPDGQYERVVGYDLGPVPAWQRENEPQPFDGSDRWCGVLELMLPASAEDIERAHSRQLAELGAAGQLDDHSLSELDDALARALRMACAAELTEVPF